MVKEQYPENSYSLKSFDIKFSSDPDISDIGIKVLDIETLKENGWEYSLENCGESSKVIYNDCMCSCTYNALINTDV